MVDETIGVQIDMMVGGRLHADRHPVSGIQVEHAFGSFGPPNIILQLLQSLTFLVQIFHPVPPNSPHWTAIYCDLLRWLSHIKPLELWSWNWPRGTWQAHISHRFHHPVDPIESNWTRIVYQHCYSIVTALLQHGMTAGRWRALPKSLPPSLRGKRAEAIRSNSGLDSLDVIPACPVGVGVSPCLGDLMYCFGFQDFRHCHEWLHIESLFDPFCAGEITTYLQRLFQSVGLEGIHRSY